MSTTLRPELSDFSSIVCLKSIITGMEEALGDKATAIALVAAGRARGKKLAEALGLTTQSISLDEIASKVAFALGKDGTRLLILDKIEQDGEGFKVYTRETVCSAGEPMGSPRKCTFTLGAVQGVLEAITGKRFRGQQTESVLRGGTADLFEYAPIG
jgi:predicted hydrocarbon binding protein